MTDKTAYDLDLSERQIRDITEFIYDYEIPKAESAEGRDVQILGNLAFIPALAEKICGMGKARAYIISGGINPRYSQPENKHEAMLVENLYMGGWPYAKKGEMFKLPEAYLIKAALTHAIPRFDRIPARLEAESTNTYENFSLSYDLGHYKDVLSLVIVTTAENALRALGSARAVLPSCTKAEAAPYVASIPPLEAFADRERWMDHPLSRGLILSEIAECYEYSRRGGIALSKDKAALLDQITQSLKTR
ncbi:MAG: YdcF family protein [Rickettsiales bacterium]|jgi:hypothetical protein|nr:YdcF family protein [Rickettsiales bacterium]